MPVIEILLSLVIWNTVLLLSKISRGANNVYTGKFRPLSVSQYPLLSRANPLPSAACVIVWKYFVHIEVSMYLHPFSTGLVKYVNTICHLIKTSGKLAPIHT